MKSNIKEYSIISKLMCNTDNDGHSASFEGYDQMQLVTIAVN